MPPQLLIASKTSLIFSLRLLRLGRGENDREPWGARKRRVAYERGRISWAWTELELMGQLVVPDGPPWDVKLVRLTPAGVGLDDDNLVGSFKAVRDQVADQLHVDDGDKRVIAFRYAQETLASGWGIRVEILARPAEAAGPAPCKHLPQLFRNPYGGAGEFHVVKRCGKCGTRLQEGWVPHGEARGVLKEDPWARGADPRQGRLL